jgi:hypothetical protein
MPIIKPDRHELFAQGLAVGMSQAAAYLQAGFVEKSSPAVTAAAASRLAKNVKVQTRVSELTQRKSIKVVLSRNYVIEAAIENVEKALGRKPVKVSRRVRDGDVWRTEIEDVYVYRGDVANNTLKMLASELGLFTERKEVRVTAPFENMTNEEIASELHRTAQLIEQMPKTIEHDGS